MDESYPAELGPSAAMRRRDAAAFRRAVALSLGFVALLVWVQIAEWLLGTSFGALGVRPREWLGLVGVLTAPLVHGSYEHLGANIFALVVLGTLALSAYPRASRRALPLIWIGAGLGTWLIGRPSFHIGASGITHGLMFFVFLLGVLRWERRAIAIALVTFLLYGGMVMTVLPREPGVSWEAHLSGAVMGVIAAVRWRWLDPAPPKPKYSWDYEEEAARAAAERERAELELPSPNQVPVLWHRPEVDDGPKVLPFRRPGEPPRIEDEPPTTTRH